MLSLSSVTAAATALALSWTALVAVGILVVGQVVLFIAGLVSILSSERYTAGGKALWIVLVFCFPFLGPLAWFVGGRRAAIRTTTA